MFKKLISVSLLLFSATVFAGSYTINGVDLSDAQIAQLKADAAKISAENKLNEENRGLGSLTQNPEKVLTNASTWGTQLATAAKGFSEALGIAAHELNINVNDFLNTPAGKLTAVIIIWKVIGASALHFLAGCLIICMSLLFSRIFYIRLFTKDTTLVESTYLWGLYKTTKQVRTMKSMSDLRGEGEWFAFWIVSAAVCLGVAIAISTMLSV